LFSGTYSYSHNISMHRPNPPRKMGRYSRNPITKGRYQEYYYPSVKNLIPQIDPWQAVKRQRVGKLANITHSCVHSKRVAASHPSSWAFRRPSSDCAPSLPPSRPPSWPTTFGVLPPQVSIESHLDVFDRAYGSDSGPNGPPDDALSGSGSTARKSIVPWSRRIDGSVTAAVARHAMKEPIFKVNCIPLILALPGLGDTHTQTSEIRVTVSQY